MFPHISGTSSKGICTAWKWLEKGILLLTLLLQEIWMCKREVIASSQEHAVPPATSGPCFSPLCLPRQVGAGWERPGVLGWPGQGIQGCSHRLLRGRRGAGGGRAAPVAWQLPCKSPSCQKTFFSSDLDGFSQAQDQVWMIRWFKET